MEDNQSQLQQKINDLQNEIEQKLSQKTYTVQNNQKLIQKNEENKNKIIEIENRLKEINNYIQAREEEVKTKQEELNKLKNLNQPKKLVMEQDTYKQWCSLGYELLQKEGEEKKLQENLKYLEDLGKYQPPPPIENPEEAVTSFYDLVVDIDSLLAVLQGWSFHINEKYKSAQEQNDFINYLEKDKCLIGIVGMSNKGKSHLLGQINCIQVPAGFDVHTHGLSFVKGNDKAKLYCDFIDSQGLGVALQYKLNEKVKKLIQEIMNRGQKQEKVDLLNKEKSENKQTEQYKEQLAQCFNNLNQDRMVQITSNLILKFKLTEQFLQVFMMEKCHILVVVVGIQTDYEQQLITRLAKIHKDKTLIVVHNFATLFTTDQVKKQIAKDIHNCYDVLLHEPSYNQNGIEVQVTAYLDKTYQRDVESLSTSSNPVIHLIYCREGTEPAKVYNQGTLMHIRSLINQKITSQSKHMNIFAALENYFTEQFQSQFGSEFDIKFTFDKINNRFGLKKNNNFNEEKFLDKVQNSHRMPLQNSDNEPLCTLPSIFNVQENNNEYKKSSLKIDLSMVPNLRDQLNYVMDEDGNPIEIEGDTKVLVKQYGDEMKSFYFLQIKIDRPKLDEILDAEKKDGFKEIHPMNFKAIKLNKKILGTDQINLGDEMPYKYENGVLTLFLHCSNYEELLKMEEVEPIEEEKGLEKIFIANIEEEEEEDNE